MHRRNGTPIWIDMAKQAGKGLSKVDFSKKSNSGYDEEWLQDLLHKHPEVLPIGQIEPGFGDLTPLCRELPLQFGGGKAGQLDNLFATAEGQLVLVEAKLWRNPEARRAVVAQALEYAAAVFRMSYTELESAVLRARAAKGESGSSLFEIVDGKSPDATQEEFSDKLARNLSRGRAVIAVVGDGIREEILLLSELLQSHAGHRFTFALVELAVYETPSTGVHFVVPSVLAQTELIERGVVRIEDGRVVVEPPSINAGEKPVTGGVTEDEYFDALGQTNPAWPGLLRSFLSKAEDLRIFGDLQAVLSLKYTLESGRAINLGVIGKTGKVDTGYGGAADLHSMRVYNEKLAALVGGIVKFDGKGKSWVRTAGNNSYPVLSDLLPQHEQAWLDAMKQYIQDCLAASFADEQ
jgi:hypothetical protein